MCFWKIILKVRCFKTPPVPRLFWTFFPIWAKFLYFQTVCLKGFLQSFRSSDQALTSPSEVQRRISTTNAEREFDMMDGWVDGTGYQKCPSNFFILCEYISDVYTYIYPCSKFVTNFVMGLKIWCQVGEFEFHFQNSYGEMCFWKIMLKVRCFKTTGDHRPFWSKFDVKLGSWGIIHTGEHSPLEVSTKPLHLPPGSSAGFTPRARSASL